MGSIAFEEDFLEIALALVRSPFDGPLNVVLGHVYGLGILDHRPQAGIVLRVRAAFLYGNHDVFSNTRKGLGHGRPALHFSCFPEFKCSSHTDQIIFGVQQK